VTSLSSPRRGCSPPRRVLLSESSAECSRERTAASCTKSWSARRLYGINDGRNERTLHDSPRRASARLSSSSSENLQAPPSCVGEILRATPTHATTEFGIDPPRRPRGSGSLKLIKVRSSVSVKTNGARLYLRRVHLGLGDSSAAASGSGARLAGRHEESADHSEVHVDVRGFAILRKRHSDIAQARGCTTRSRAT